MSWSKEANIKGPKGDTGSDGVRGDTGAPGAGIELKGSYDAMTLASLSSMFDQSNAGEAYVSTSTMNIDGTHFVTGHLMVWSGTAFVDGGEFVGPAGPKGDTGDKGERGLRGAASNVNFDDRYLKLSGGRMSGNIDMNINTLEGVQHITAAPGRAVSIGGVNYGRGEEHSLAVWSGTTGTLIAFTSGGGLPTLHWDATKDQWIFAKKPRIPGYLTNDKRYVEDHGGSGDVLITTRAGGGNVVIGTALIGAGQNQRMTILPGTRGDLIYFLNAGGTKTLWFNGADNRWHFKVRPGGI